MCCEILIGKSLFALYDFRCERPTVELFLILITVVVVLCLVDFYAFLFQCVVEWLFLILNNIRPPRPRIVMDLPSQRLI